MAVSREQTLPEGFTNESVQRAIDSIPEDFVLACDPIPLRDSEGNIDIGGAVEKAREYSSVYPEESIHVSLVAVARAFKGDSFVMGIGEVSIYIKDNAETLEAAKARKLGSMALEQTLKL